MYIGIKADMNNEKLKNFLNNWENPKTAYTIAVDNTNVEFKIYRYKDFFIILQKNIFDVISKYLFFGSTFLLLISFWINYYILKSKYTFFGFLLGSFILLFSGLFLSKHFRFFLLKLRLRILGYKDEFRLLENDELLDKIFYEYENGTKRNISNIKK